MIRHCLWKMCATPGASHCIKPGCLARQPLCHKVNLPRCEARRHHFINRLCKNYKNWFLNWFLWCNTEHCYFKYVSFILVNKCKTKSDIRHHDISDNGSTLRGGMLSKDTKCNSAWACLNDRFSRLSLVPYAISIW